MKKINSNLYPAGGFFFKESDGTIIRSTGSWSGVIARVARYRRRNGLPPGDPKAEVHAQACERNPSHCREDVDPVAQAALKVASLKSRVLAWLSGLRGRAGELLWGDGVNAAARAAVCLNCPAHAQIAGGCGACKRSLSEIRKSLLGERNLDTRLAGCTILGEDPAVSTWIDQPPSDDPTLPACCWRRRHPPP